MVIIGIVLNDPRFVNIEEIYNSNLKSKSYFNKIIKFFEKKSYFYNFFYTSLANIYKKIAFDGKNYDQQYLDSIVQLWQGDSFDLYSKNLIEFKKNLDQKNIKLVLVVFPYTQQFTNYMNYSRYPPFPFYVRLHGRGS